MKSLLKIFAGSTIIFVLLAVSTHQTPIIPSISEVVVAILYWPAFIIAGVIALVSLIGLFASTEKSTYAIIFALSAPMLIYGFYQPEFAYEKGRSANAREESRNDSTIYLLQRHLLWYFELHPEKFKYIGLDDEVQVEGFYDFINHLQGRGKPPDWSVSWSVKNNQFIDPWGKPYRYYLDRGKDGYIQVREQKVSVNEYSDPWQKKGFFYSAAIGIASEHYNYITRWTDYDEWLRRDEPWRSLFGQP